MKIPKIIKTPNTYLDLMYKNADPGYTTYKFNKKVYEGCYEYIHFWRNRPTDKWKCFKIYLEKGNNLYREWQEHLKGKKTRTIFK